MYPIFVIAEALAKAREQKPDPCAHSPEDLLGAPQPRQARIQGWLRPSRKPQASEPSIRTQRKPMNFKVIAVGLVLILAACSQAPSDRYTLQSVNDKPLPAVLFDDVIQDPGEPPYRFRIEVAGGWFRLEGNRYQQAVYFRSFIDGQSGHKWQWSEHGSCSPNGDKLRCESGYLQNYAFDLIQQGNQLVTRQPFSEPALEGTYTFSK